jgi:Predicted methyltransferase
LKYVRIRSEDAAKEIDRLMEMDIVDKNAKIRKTETHRLVPILPGNEDKLKDCEIIEDIYYSRERKSPQEKICLALHELPENIKEMLPMKWEYVGEIAILKTDIPDEYKSQIGEVYAEVLGMKTICIDRGVSGEFRRPDMEVVFGSDTVSSRLENGIRYEFDVTKVMYSSGNTDERERMAKLDCSDEVVWDMFAGIGYFSLPIAKFANPLRVISTEKNPDSYEFLVRNAELNDVSDVLFPVLGDNRHMHSKAFADRILMGYVQRTSEFLETALIAIKDNGIIHYHDTFYVNEYKDKIREIFDSQPCEYEILGIKEVKSFAPSVSHYVADVKIKQTPLNRKL